MKINKTILVIDDDVDLCALIKYLMTKENYTVECAISLTEAELKLKQRPEIVLLDNYLPDGYGIDFIQMHPVEFMKSYVILMTADPNKSVELKAKNEGIPIFIHKPFTVERIKELILQAA
jgi:Response regulator containing CheY-like receiver, AAA-type ATPase, and DNA-binding domains